MSAVNKDLPRRVPPTMAETGRLPAAVGQELLQGVFPVPSLQKGNITHYILTETWRIQRCCWRRPQPSAQQPRARGARGVRPLLHRVGAVAELTATFAVSRGRYRASIAQHSCHERKVVGEVEPHKTNRGHFKHLWDNNKRNEKEYTMAAKAQAADVVHNNIKTNNAQRRVCPAHCPALCLVRHNVLANAAKHKGLKSPRTASTVGRYQVQVSMGVHTCTWSMDRVRVAETSNVHNSRPNCLQIKATSRSTAVGPKPAFHRGSIFKPAPFSHDSCRRRISH